jgi:hypothetical protein
MNYQKGFGGMPRDSFTKHSTVSMPFMGKVQYSGNGRDGYICNDNGGFYVSSGATPIAGGGSFDYGVRRFGKNVHKLSSSNGKVVHYIKDGKGRDSYISDTNGGFTASTPVAEYQNTFVNRLRSYERIDNYKPRNTSTKSIKTSAFL